MKNNKNNGTEPPQVKKIEVTDLCVGMHIHDMDGGWLSHDFMRTNFAVKNEKVLGKVRKSGLKHVYIDTSRGLDMAGSESRESVVDRVEHEIESISSDCALAGKNVSVEEEMAVAKNIVKEANTITKNLMSDIRLGKQVEVDSFEPIAEKIMDSVMRNKDALVSLTRMKTKDDYTFMHSVSVSGLMVNFARSEGMNDDQIKEIALGGVLHDIGKMMVPDDILNKPGKLTDDEFVTMKSHVDHSRELLDKIPGMTPSVIDVVLQHHERADGTGYPGKLKGDEISVVGSMSAIVDVYDALTSVRIYKDAWEPTNTLKKMVEWSDNHFNKKLLSHFIRCLGIYPVGTMVEMKSGRVGVVLEQSEKEITKPIVRFFYNRKSGYIPVEIIDLSITKDDDIRKAVSPTEYGVDMSSFVQ